MEGMRKKSKKKSSNLNFLFDSDSQAVIKSLQKGTTKNEIIKNGHITLNELIVFNNKVILLTGYQDTKDMIA